MMNLKPFIKELLLLITIALAVILIFWFGSQIYPRNTSFEIALNDTYFIIAGKLFILPVFLGLIMIIYIVKEAIYFFRRKFQNIVLLISTLLFNIYLLFFAKFFTVFFAVNGGRTVYPPLSALRDNNPPMSLSGVDRRLTILLFIQIFFLIILVIIAILTGKNWNINKREQELP